ncbi:MAG: sigma-54 dependent transcriptional regulator [Prolixibacteraceae bacterium]|jgi:two-component system response regulator AtoC|nr:sigma-54 dependent transcriptional regulator [Prolixibacteraceae bacterium]
MNQGKYKIFVVDDNALFLRVLQKTLAVNEEYNVIPISSGKECINRLNEKPDIVSLDYTLPDYNGKEILEKIKELTPETQVIIVSGQNDINTAIELLKIGAYDYIVKSVDTREKISIAIKKIIERLELTKENKILKEAISQEYSFRSLIKGSSKAMEMVFKMMGKAAQSNITISVFGETGTGKELVAKGVHYNSARSNKPFVPVNISSIPETLIESELFGYEKGAFTGAEGSKQGKIELAHEGTLFLDEIAEMNLNIQAKLLRVLQERELVRLGSNKTIKFDVRIIIATHRDLQEQVQKGNFREDLYFRLLGLSVNLPPLHERDNDCILLGKHFVNEFCDENKMDHKQLSDSARQKIKSYSFPGNVRELKALMELACVLSDDDVIDESHININPVNLNKNLLSKEKTLQEYNEDIIQHFVDKYKNVREAARRLGVGKSTIYRYLQAKEEKE